LPGAGLGPTPDNMINNTKLSSPEETRPEFNLGPGAIKLGIDVHQAFYVVVVQAGGDQPQAGAAFQQRSLPRLGGAAVAQAPGARDPRGL
jgi:hypothetical protein